MEGEQEEQQNIQNDDDNQYEDDGQQENQEQENDDNGHQEEIENGDHSADQHQDNENKGDDNHNEFQTPVSLVKEDNDLTEGSPSHMQKSSQSKALGSGKNFIEMNLKVKSKKEIQQEYKQKKQDRISHISERKSVTSLMTSRFNNPFEKEAPTQGLDWGKTVIKNNLVDRIPQKPSIKNQSNGFVDKQSQATSLGQVYSMSKKEKSWHQTNASNINLLNSYKTLDMPDKSEDNLVPQILANVELKQNLNLKSQLDNVNKTNIVSEFNYLIQHNYVNADEKPKQYNSYQEKNQIIHNKNNTFVQNMRMKTFTSQVFGGV